MEHFSKCLLVSYAAVIIDFTNSSFNISEGDGSVKVCIHINQGVIESEDILVLNSSLISTNGETVDHRTIQGSSFIDV